MDSGASGSGSKEDDVERMMAELGLEEQDLDDVIMEEVMEIPKEATRWTAVVRVHTQKPYSQYWFYKNIRAA